jgi:hypothetical protein
LIPLGIVSAAGAGVTAVPTKIFLLAEITSAVTQNGVTGAPVTAFASATPEQTTNSGTSNPYELLAVTLTATLTSGLDEDYFSNPVVGQSVYFKIGVDDQIGTSSLGSGSSETMTTGTNGQISKTFTGEEWITFYNGDNIQAIFDGNIEGTLSASESGTMIITGYGPA